VKFLYSGIGLSLVFSGSMVNGDRMRANFAAETTEERQERTSTTARLALLGLPNVVVACLLYYKKGA
jgi:hypothetical protein